MKKVSLPSAALCAAKPRRVGLTDALLPNGAYAIKHTYLLTESGEYILTEQDTQLIKAKVQQWLKS